jgi:hypothetical protein
MTKRDIEGLKNLRQGIRLRQPRELARNAHKLVQRKPQVTLLATIPLSLAWIGIVALAGIAIPTPENCMSAPS